MEGPPSSPKIYHITHVRNLSGILRDGCLWSDSERIQRQLNCEVVGMRTIKRRRLGITVDCHPGTRVGDYVPFYFCPRSVMLFLLHMGNHPELDYKEGQGPIVHLQADLRRVVSWASSRGIPWSFSDKNAADAGCRFFNDYERVDQIDWTAVFGSDWRDPVVKSKKQAEFLVFRGLPWGLIEAIGVYQEDVLQRVQTELLGQPVHRPIVEVRREWYYH